jgi:hypothetical protein
MKPARMHSRGVSSSGPVSAVTGEDYSVYNGLLASWIQKFFGAHHVAAAAFSMVRYRTQQPLFNYILSPCGRLPYGTALWLGVVCIRQAWQRFAAIYMSHDDQRCQCHVAVGARCSPCCTAVHVTAAERGLYAGVAGGSHSALHVNASPP